MTDDEHKRQIEENERLRREIPAWYRGYIERAERKARPVLPEADEWTEPKTITVLGVTTDPDGTRRVNYVPVPNGR